MAPSIRKKLALTSPTSCGHSVGIVRSWTQATGYHHNSGHYPSSCLYLKTYSDGSNTKSLPLSPDWLLLNKDRTTDNVKNCDSYTVKVRCIILRTNAFCHFQKIIWGEKECRCFVRGEWHVFPFSKEAYNRNSQPTYSENLMTLQ
jgi:hypothetical protein